MVYVHKLNRLHFSKFADNLKVHRAMKSTGDRKSLKSDIQNVTLTATVFVIFGNINITRHMSWFLFFIC
jgi:hypothetical protein